MSVFNVCLDDFVLYVSSEGEIIFIYFSEKLKLNCYLNY